MNEFDPSFVMELAYALAHGLDVGGSHPADQSLATLMGVR